MGACVHPPFFDAASHAMPRAAGARADITKSIEEQSASLG